MPRSEEQLRVFHEHRQWPSAAGRGAPFLTTPRATEDDGVTAFVERLLQRHPPRVALEIPIIERPDACGFGTPFGGGLVAALTAECRDKKLGQKS